MDDHATFTAETASVRRARHWATRWCQAEGDAAQADTLALVISELVSNAVIHGAGPIELSLERRSGRIIGHVRDHDPTPLFRHVQRGEVGGWGLDIVATLTDSWGVDYDSTGKSIHFTLTPSPT